MNRVLPRLLAGSLLLSAAAALCADSPPPSAPAFAPRLSAPFPDPEAAFRQAMEILKRDGYSEIDDQLVYHAAIEGVLRAVAPPTQRDMLELRDPEVQRKEAQKTSGQMLSIGVGLKVVDGWLTIADVIPGSPAEREDVRIGDHLLLIDGKELRGLTLGQAEGMLYQPKGVKIVLTLSREDRMINKIVPCEEVTAKNVRTEVFKGVGVVRVLFFSETVPQELPERLADLQKRGVNRLVLDLRGCPGGVFDAAEQAACRFLPPEATVVQLVGRARQARRFVCSRAASGDARTPLVLLADHDTASSAEMMLAALQGNHRGAFVGMPTRGYATLKRIEALKNGFSFTFITDVLYGPDGQTWLERGLSPDREVAMDPAAVGDARLQRDPAVRLRRDPQLAAALSYLGR